MLFSFGQRVTFKPEFINSIWKKHPELPWDGVIISSRLCDDCKQWEYNIVWLRDNKFWVHEKFLELLPERENMSDSLEEPTYMEPYKKNEIFVYPKPSDKNLVKETNFETLKRINPTLYDLFDRCVNKIIEKNHDYAGKDDFYRNFRKSESIDIPAWKGIFVRFQDKVSRVEGFIKTGVLLVKDESFLDTCIDGANYLLLMCACWLDSQTKKAHNFNPKGYNTEEDRYLKSRIDQSDAP